MLVVVYESTESELVQAVDDEIRAVIVQALEEKRCTCYEDFCGFVLPAIRKVVKKYPTLEKCLKELLSEIEEPHIVVVESGCSGTFPMLLMSLDERVQMRMYTTYPYLLDVYGECIYTAKYKENRLFETMYSQDLYLQYSGIYEGRFYVKKCQNKDVEKGAFAEIKAMLAG